jgi:plasmid stabilization system protein ParE
MTYRVRYTRAAREDLHRLFTYLAQRDLQAARRARGAIAKAADFLAEFPFACRKADTANPFLRELLIPFGSSGYVVLYEIGEAEMVTLLAIRHQREEDYH